MYIAKALLFLIIIAFIAFVVTYVLQMKQQDSFVTAKGQALYLGDQQFRSVGVNRYNLLTRVIDDGQTVGCANSFTDEEIDVKFSQLQSIGITTVRFWMFQSFTQSGDDLTRFDYLLKTADKYNIKLIPVFENHWRDCTEADIKSESWYESGYTSPYGEYPLSLKAYISKIVPLYRDNPTILAWEIMNEARDAEDHVLYAFAKDVSQHIKQLDSNHLVSVGMITTSNSDVTEKIYALQSIDLFDYHDYDDDMKALPDTLSEHMTAAKQSNKPTVVGEAGILDSESKRPELFQAKMNAFFNNGGSIYMIWSYGEPYVTNDSYNFDSSDPLAEVVKQKAAEIKKKSM